ncbi:unnamed protein product [Scytosiphon promiscuus]
MSDQPQYYRITDSLESLSIRIRLRKIFGRSVNTKPKAVGTVRSRRENDGEDQDRLPGSFVPGDEADVRVKWQEKIFGPEDIITVSSGQRSGHTPPQQRAVGPLSNPLARLERDYGGHLDDLRRDGVDPLGSLSEVMLFTYTDKDGFVPPSSNTSRGDGSGGGGGLTTGDRGTLSYLEEAVTNMPRKTATSSPDGTVVSGGGGLTVGINRTGVSETAAVIQTHLAREDKFKVMYIMAAVDVDVRGAKKEAKIRANSPGGARWKRGGDGAGGVHLHEQVVCSIKAHQNGTLEIAPAGFSAEEPESGDEGAFLTDHTLKVMDKEGARLTTYRFTSPSGGVFSYTVENDSEPGGGVEEMEAWEAEEASRDLWKKASRQQTAGGQLLGAPAAGGAVALHAFMEIVSASGFTGVDRLYTEYGLCLPRTWSMAESEGGASGERGENNDGRDEGFVEGRGRATREHGEFAAAGTTQVACQDFPLAVPHRSVKFDGTTSKSHASGNLGHAASFSSPLAPSPAGASMYGSSTMPTAFQAPPRTAASGATLRVGSAVLLCFLGLLGSLGESPLLWVVFGGAVVVVAALSGDGGYGGWERGEGGVPVAHFGFPAEFHLFNDEEGETAGLGERPQVLLAVSSLDSLARHRVEGYGYLSFPRQAGAHELFIRTWRPVCSLRTHLQDFFVGGAHRLHDPRYASKPGGFTGTFLNRFGFRTETSGTLRVRLQLAEQGRVCDLQAVPGAAGVGPGIDLAGTRTVKEILRMVNAKRMGTEIGRRFSATAESTSPAATHPTTTSGSAAPAAAAPAASSGIGTARHKGNASRGTAAKDCSDTPLSSGHNASMPLLGSRNPFEKTVEGGARTEKVKAATDLLARVRGQLERSEQRTKGLLVEGRGVSDIAPTR